MENFRPGEPLATYNEELLDKMVTDIRPYLAFIDKNQPNRTAALGAIERLLHRTVQDPDLRDFGFHWPQVKVPRSMTMDDIKRAVIKAVCDLMESRGKFKYPPKPEDPTDLNLSFLDDAKSAQAPSPGFDSSPLSHGASGNHPSVRPSKRRHTTQSTTSNKRRRTTQLATLRHNLFSRVPSPRHNATYLESVMNARLTRIMLGERATNPTSCRKAAVRNGSVLCPISEAAINPGRVCPGNSLQLLAKSAVPKDLYREMIYFMCPSELAGIPCEGRVAEWCKTLGRFHPCPATHSDAGCSNENWIHDGYMDIPALCLHTAKGKQCERGSECKYGHDEVELRKEVAKWNLNTVDYMSRREKVISEHPEIVCHFDNVKSLIPTPE